MKYVLLVPDGAADMPLPELDNRTPLQTARMPALHRLAARAQCGSTWVTPPDMYPGSDAANMALLGYDPVVHYTGRGPIEAAALEVPLGPTDAAFRCSLVSTDGRALTDYSAGHVATAEARALVALAQEKLGTRALHLFPGSAYRHILRWTDGPTGVWTAAPHEHVGEPISSILPTGDGDAVLRRFIDDSINLLDPQPYNRRRTDEGLPPANMLWPWSPGRSPQLAPFARRHGVTGAVIAGVDVARGLGRLAALEVVDVPGATGWFDTDYGSKARCAAEALRRHDFAWIHVEAPDEAGHAGNVERKVEALERIDSRLVAPLIVDLERIGDFRLLIAPDHATPVATRKHGTGPVPFLLYDSTGRTAGRRQLPFDERVLAETRGSEVEGWRLSDLLFADG